MEDVVIIDDEYFEEMGEFVESSGETVNNLMELFLEIMNSVQDDGIVNGELASALSDYMEFVRRISGELYAIAVSVHRGLSQFIRDIERMDRYQF